MTNKTSYSRSIYLSKCYNISGLDLANIANTIKNLTGTSPLCSISLDDNSSISSDDTQSLISDTVLNVVKISSIRISASYRNKIALDSLAINFDPSRFSGPVYISINGQRDTVGAAETEILQLMEGKKRWFWPINYSGKPFVLLAYLLVAAVISFLALLAQFQTIKTEIRNEYFTLLAIVFAIGLVVYVSVLKDVRNFIFPSLEFRIGRSGDGARFRDVIRTFLIGTLLIGVSISLLSNYLYDKVK